MNNESLRGLLIGTIADVRSREIKEENLLTMVSGGFCNWTPVDGERTCGEREVPIEFTYGVQSDCEDNKSSHIEYLTLDFSLSWRPDNG